MSTLDTFKEMADIAQTTALEITLERAQEIIQTISSNHREQGIGTLVNILPVSTYVAQSKEEDAGSAYVSPKQPPFASHWGIVVGDPNEEEAFLLHLLLSDKNGKRRVRFRITDLEPDGDWITGAAVKQVGHTSFSMQQLLRIGKDMIAAFGNYHVVFWNCQMFAKCYLHVITGSDAAFTQWTSADATNLFLCALVVPIPIASTSRLNEQRKMKQLRHVGMLAVTGHAIEGGRSDLTEEELFKTSDEVIDLMKESWRDDETLKKLSQPVKDSADKPGLIRGIKSLILKVIGYE